MGKHAMGTVKPLLRDPIFILVAVVAIAVPRIARIAYPELVIEDDFYLQNAFLVSAGDRPYLDFTLNHFPLLEYALAGLIRIFGPSVGLAEYVTQACVAFNTAAVLIIASRLCDRRAGLAAAALYSCSALVFKYHLFEREFFTSACMAAGLYCWLFMRSSRLGPALTGCLFALAAILKLTSGVFFCAIVLWAFLLKRRRECAWMLAVFVSLLAGCTLLCVALYGREFIFQVFIFHFMKGCRSLPGRIECFVENTDFTVFAGLLGFFFYRARAHAESWNLIRLLTAACPVFFVFFSSTVWPHNLLEMLMFSSLLGGAYIRTLPGVLAAVVGKPAPRIKSSVGMLAGAAAVAGVFVFVQPWTIEGADKRMSNTYGFGFVARRDISEAVQFVAAHTRDCDYICCPVPLIAYASARRKLIHYWESAGVELWVQRQIARDGLWRTWRRAAAIRFVDLISTVSSTEAREVFERGIKEKEPALIVEPDFKGEEPFAARLAHGIFFEHTGPVVFRNRSFKISRFKMKSMPNDND